MPRHSPSPVGTSLALEVAVAWIRRTTIAPVEVWGGPAARTRRRKAKTVGIHNHVLICHMRLTVKCLMADLVPHLGFSRLLG